MNSGMCNVHEFLDIYVVIFIKCVNGNLLKTCRATELDGTWGNFLDIFSQLKFNVA